MSGLSYFFPTFYILGCIYCGSGAWQVKMPSHIKGLLNSCLVIPCSYNYYQYPPTNPDRVVWYQYVSRGYPLVYDNWSPYDVIDEFRGKTSRIYDGSRTCSLMIYPVSWLHHRQKIYPWVDPENVGRSTYRFFDTTVTIEVVDRAEKPKIMIFGEKKVGKSVVVQCTVHHSCPTYPPTVTLNIPLNNHQVSDDCRSDGICAITLSTTFDIVKDQQTVICSVSHRGGVTESSYETLNAECSFSPLTISSTLTEFLEGQESKVTCTVLYTCSQHVPTLRWNYDKMPASTNSKEIGKAQWQTVSTLTFTASATDNGNSLICYAQFSQGQRQEARITLRVKSK